MDVFDVSGESSLPYVNIVYDYAGNDAYAAEKMFNTSEAVVVVTETMMEVFHQLCHSL